MTDSINSNDLIVAAFKAAESGDREELARLLDLGVPPDSTDGEGDTLLITAVSKRQAECARLLLSRGAKPNGVLDDGEPIWMASYRSENAQCIRVLIEHGADPNKCQGDDSRHTLLMHLAVEPSDLSNLIELLKHKPNLDARNEEDESPLTYAIAYGNVKAVRLLLDSEVDINARVCKGETALIVATGAHNETTNEIINLLLDRGADANIGSTEENELVPHHLPLMTYVRCHAPSDENLVVLRRIATLTHDINYKTPEGKTALRMAREAGFQPYIDLLFEFGGKE
ncbi:MAG: ankyrin repeat domain-containing protein [Planctomycetes bacterium]|nr:ankyrin repeat domain-containing protein [Planctomycetota bacterium]